MTRVRRIWYAAWPITLLCVLTSSRWMVEGALPQTSSTLLSQSVGCAIAAGLVGIIVAFRGQPLGFGAGAVRRRFVPVIGGCLVLTGPVVAQGISGRRFGADAATLALALVPAIAAVASSAAGYAEAGDLPGLLWPGLAGLGGLLLLLPEPSLVGWRQWAGLFCLPLLVGVGGATVSQTADLEGRGRTGSRDWTVIGGLLLAAGVFLAFWIGSLRRTGWSVGMQACGLDGLSALLTLTALGRLGARRWSTQFLLVPLLGLVEGMVFLRPVLDSRSWLGLGLVLIGGVYQLLPRESQDLRLRPLHAQDVSGR